MKKQSRGKWYLVYYTGLSRGVSNESWIELNAVTENGAVRKAKSEWPRVFATNSDLDPRNPRVMYTRPLELRKKKK